MKKFYLDDEGELYCPEDLPVNFSFYSTFYVLKLCLENCIFHIERFENDDDIISGIRTLLNKVDRLLGLADDYHVTVDEKKAND